MGTDLEMNALSLRLARLERSNRRWRAGSLFAFAAAAILMLAGARFASQEAPNGLPKGWTVATPPTHDVRSMQFDLVDGSGRVRAKLFDGADGSPALLFYNRVGVVEGSLGGNALLLGSGVTGGQLVATSAPKYDVHGNFVYGPALAISDSSGFQAVVGATASETPKTGETQRTSAASIILWGSPGKDGKSAALWQAPNPF